MENTTYNNLLNSWNSYEMAKKELKAVELMVNSLGLSAYNGFVIKKSKKIQGWFVATGGGQEIAAGNLLELLSDVNDTQHAFDAVYKELFLKMYKNHPAFTGLVIVK